MKILVTGCAGFIGSNLCEYLLYQKHTIWGIDNFDDFYAKDIKLKNLSLCLSNPLFQFIETDIGNNTALDMLPSGIDVVIHLAAKVGVLPSLLQAKAYIDTNIQGTKNILEWMQKRGVDKLIFASSSSIYGNQSPLPFSEMHLSQCPISVYAASKQACELFNYTYHYNYHLDIISLRFFTVYGRRQRPDLAIHKFVRNIKNNIPITLYGDGNSARDYTYIDDIIAGIDGALGYLTTHKNIYENINLGSNNPIKLNELASIIYRQLNKKEDIHYLPMQSGDVNITFADIQKAQKLLHYNHSTSIEEGIAKFIQWYEQQ